MSHRWNEHEYGGPYRGGEYNLGYRNYDQSRYEDQNREGRWYNEHDPRYGDPSFYYGGFLDREGISPFEGRENFGTSGYGHVENMGRRDRYEDSRMYDQGAAGRSSYGDRVAGERYHGSRDDLYYNDDRGYRNDRSNYMEDRYEDYRNPRFSQGERFGESHQHRYHARTSDNWDRPAAYNTGGYGSDDFYNAGDYGAFRERSAGFGNDNFDMGDFGEEYRGRRRRR